MPSLPAKLRNALIVSLPMLLALGLCGCGRETGHVLGIVTENGQPVKSGMITFINKDGKGTALAPIKKDGTYTARNVAAGETLVILVNAMEEPDFAGPMSMAQMTKPASKPVVSKRPTVIPDKFSKPETSGLRLTVRAGTNPFDIDVAK